MEQKLKQDIVAIIPCRMGSSRFPGKPLKLIHGIPMIEHVRRRAQLSTVVQNVIVATCDDEIRMAVEEFGGKVVMTSNQHVRCTDRVEEAISKMDAKFVVMVQGDEPLLVPSVLDAVLEPLLKNPTMGVSQIVHPIKDLSEIDDRNVVKAVLSASGKVLYFSRLGVPGFMNERTSSYFKQSGIMAFERGTLVEYAKLSPTPYEIQESIDMLRFLEHDRSIHAVVSEHATRGVDVPSDLVLVEKMMLADPVQKAILDQTILAKRNP